MEPGSGGKEDHEIQRNPYDPYFIRSKENDLRVSEPDLAEMTEEKKERVEKAGLDSDAAYVPCDLSKPGWTEELISIGFDTKTKSFGSLPGTCYQTVDESTVTKKNEILAARAGEQMKAAYFPDELVLILQNCRFLINEHLNHKEMTEQYLEDHNAENPRHLMQAPEGVGYIPAVKSAE